MLEFNTRKCSVGVRATKVKVVLGNTRKGSVRIITRPGGVSELKSSQEYSLIVS